MKSLKDIGSTELKEIVYEEDSPGYGFVWLEGFVQWINCVRIEYPIMH